MILNDRRHRSLILSVLLLAVPALSLSCSSAVVEFEPYPVYPPRHDPIVVANPAAAPTAPAPPGQLDAWLLNLNAAGGKVLDPRRLSDADQTKIAAALETIFGTPPAPKLDEMNLNPAELADGSKLFRRHCANCHGLTGDGRGPAGLFVFPHARDLRLGIMKYAATADGTPTRSDLTRVIKEGVPGTSMPPFQLADEKTIDRLVTATVHLSIRGEVEMKLMKQILDDDAPDDIAAEAKRLTAKAVARWQAATSVPLAESEPKEPSDDRIRHGHDLFVSAKAGCINCHVDYGRKDEYRHDLWGTASKVANLTDHKMRGGSTLAEVRRRIRLGIPAVGMPAQSALSDSEIDALATFVIALPRPLELPADVRAKVYPNR